MKTSIDTISTVLGAVCAGIAVLSSIPVLHQAHALRKRSQHEGQIRLSELYEDKDGQASEKSQAEYHDYVKWPKYIALIASFIGMVFSIVLAVRAIVSVFNSWILGWPLISVAWTLVLSHSIYLVYEKDFKLTFRCALHQLLINVVITASLVTEFVLILQNKDLVNTVEFILFCGESISSIVIIVCCLVIPRRPDVFYQGRLVDGEHTVSIFSRMTYWWIMPLLRLANKNMHLDEEDANVLSDNKRTRSLKARFNAAPKQNQLWKQLIVVHSRQICHQIIGQALVSAGQFLPAFFTLMILRTLEKRDETGHTSYEAWLYALGLLLSMIVDTIIDGYVLYVGYGNLNVKIRNQLASLVFSKTMRKKDVKGSQKDDKTTNRDDTSSNHENDAKRKKKEDDTDDNALKALKQGVVNLIAVDASRVGVFSAWGVIFIEVIVAISVGLYFLYRILGWQATLAGISANILFLPLNTYAAKMLLSSQDRLMATRDKRMAVISEALSGIRQIKFSALEDQWEKRIGDVRKEELGHILRVCIGETILIFLYVISPVLFGLISLSIYAIMNGDLPPSTAFTALTIFANLEFALGVLPEVVGDLVDAYVSCKRIQDYLESPEKKESVRVSDHIAFRDASVAWATDNDENQEDRFVLRNLDIEFPRNELSVISGSTGSGKSLLLHALLGEADVLAGSVEMPRAPALAERYDAKAHLNNWILPNAVAYVAQIPWMENASIKANILFGLPLMESRYRKVLKACALTKDLEMLEDGDLTEIGANGINLSGGQKWRLSFARALYSRAGIVILDDIFSAVDAHVGKQIFKYGLTGELMKGRTRILVTHHVNLCLSKAKYAVCLKDGSTEHAGEVSELRRTGSLQKIVLEVEGETVADDNFLSVEDAASAALSDGAMSTGVATPQNGLIEPKKIPKTFIQIETREQGAVKRQIYTKYLNATGGFPFWIGCLLMFCVSQGFTLYKSYWLKQWTGSDETESADVHLFKMSSYPYSMADIRAAVDEHPLKYWIIGYGVISAINILGTFKYALLFWGGLKASRVVFEEMTYAILRTPLRWLDTVPIGRIMNRFSADFDKFDFTLASHMGFFLYCAISVTSFIVAGAIVSPYTLVFALFLLVLSWYYATYYLAASRELRRMESNRKSPIFELYYSVLSGVGTIRAFGKSEEYINTMFQRIDTYGELSYHMWLANRWMSTRLSFTGAFFSTVVALVIIAVPSITASLAGFALSFATQYTWHSLFAVRRYADLELDMNSTERIIEYSLLEIESQDGATPPAAWPTEGNIKFSDVVVGYDPSLPPVLKGLSFEVNPRERVGVVGRTGAGKSSLTLALFRFLKATEGSIWIDGLDISKIPLHDLRSRLAIIPQDPVLFSGTIRSNLDAFNEHDDTALYDALKRAHLIESSSQETPSNTSINTPANANVFESLTSKIAEGGLNLSQGQRQLLCLARAIVSRPKIMVLDEATSAVDMDTDALIQKSVREEFSSTTLLVIAHRLQTIIDYDRVLVLSDGTVVEFDTPWNLIEKRGLFWEMIMQTGDSETLIDTAKKSNDEKQARVNGESSSS